MAENKQGGPAVAEPLSSDGGAVADKVTSVAADVKQEAVSAAVDVRDEAAGAAVDLKEQATAELSSLTGETRREATHIVHDAREVLMTQADTATRQLASTIAGTGHELAQMAEGSDQPDGPATQIVRQLANRTEAFAGRLERDGYQGIAADIARLGRNRPGLFLAAAGITGFAVGRLLRNTDTGAIAEAAKDQATNAPSPAAQPSPEPALASGNRGPTLAAPAGIE